MEEQTSEKSVSTLDKQVNIEKEKTKRTIILVVATVVIVAITCGCCGTVSLVNSNNTADYMPMEIDSGF